MLNLNRAPRLSTTPKHTPRVTTTCTNQLACCAGRPDFTPRDRQSAEAFFITSLEQWRRAIGLEKMILMGHSMGGYLSATYAFQYPERIQHLVLVGPAGIVRASSHALYVSAPCVIQLVLVTPAGLAKKFACALPL